MEIYSENSRRWSGFLHLKHRCESNSLLSAHVQFMGAVQYSEMQREYELSDVLIMPSIRETTGTVLIEAMSQGMPVITINKFGGAILVDENTGWLYNGENRKSYIDGLKMQWLLVLKIRKK